MADTARTRTTKRWSALQTERSSWLSHWRDISDHILPRSGRFFLTDRNRGEKRHNNIYDNTGTLALRVLGAGMMSGATSPARPWFRLGTEDPDLMQRDPVKRWLHDVTRIILAVFDRSNTYRALHQVYEELGAFGTAATIVTDDFDSVIRHHSLTAGEYAIATDHRGNVTTLYREFQMTVGQLVGQFGKDRCSLAVRNLFDAGNLDAWVTVIHAIEPRGDRDATKRDAKNMAWRSCYFEIGADADTYLSESGFEQFPALCPRWTVSGGDIYGQSPAMEALGDIRQLQHQQLRKAQGIDYLTKPPLQAPASMKNRAVDMLPGGISYVDMSGPQGGIRTAFEARIDLSHLLADIQDVRERIRSAFYADLFLMLANDTRSGITATEVAERHEEKLLMLGPVTERLHNELLSPMVEMTFARCLRAGILPPPPDDLQGRELNIEFVSMLAQAQRAVGTSAVDRFVGSLGAVAQVKPDVLDKFDADEWADIYSDMLGVDPKLIVADDRVALIRTQRAQAQQQAQQAEMMQAQAKTARDLASADTSGQNALTDVTRMFSGYTT